MLRAMKQAARLVLAATIAASACTPRPSAAPPPAPPPTPAAVPQPPRLAADELPSLDRWRRHLTEELMPFWTTPDALGTPIGNFPTFRCPDGSAYRPAAPCPELAKAPGWITAELPRDYMRMKSRQTFTYGVAYHVTGEERYLEYARAGVQWLREHAYERSGSAISYWEAGKPGPAPERRTAQDLAYAQLGLVFYYYLTRDPEVLADLVALERHVMKEYWDASLGPGGMLRWVLADGDTPGDSLRQELVSQLDQINAYMLLLAPLLEDPAAAAAWQRDLLALAGVIKDRYFAPEHGMFWGVLHDPAQRKLGGRHTDFGHSMKALWMLYLVGQATARPDLVAFARPHVAPLLARAAQPSGCWASEVRTDGSLSRGSQWWIHAELDQAAATLALREPAAAGGHAPEGFSRHLPKSYACWFERFVDPQGKELWPFVPADWTPTTFASGGGGPKAFHWKNGYHGAEHALVALITTAGLTGQRLPLYFAFVRPPDASRIQPYYFRARIAARRDHPLPGHPGLRGTAVEFADIR
jgi:mannose/cellobiose epimerase-like protein (N-acyl-D-glucosamine 2-epimerase family)